MAIDLQEFAAGDTDYIAKMNSNVAALEDAINNLQSAMVAMGTTYTIAEFLTGLFSGQTTLIGTGSYLPTVSGTDLNVAAGYVYKATTQAVLFGASTVLHFVGQGAGTYYIVPDAAGIPGLSTESTDAMYSVSWNGAALSNVTRVANAMFTASEEDAARKSTALGTDFTSLDGRLEAAEALIATAEENAAAAAISCTAAEAAQAEVDALEVVVSGLQATMGVRTRKIGLSLDGGANVIETGTKGAIQVDFNGTIIGWSCIAQQSGSISVEVDRKRTSPPTAPPSAPPIPNTTTDKISASAPIALSSAQSAARAEAGVSTWSTDVLEWDVFQFNVVSCSGIYKATLYVNVLETL